MPPGGDCGFEFEFEFEFEFGVECSAPLMSMLEGVSLFVFSTSYSKSKQHMFLLQS